MLRHVDRCSGIGGFSLGFEWAELSKPVLFCDIEPWSRQILAKHWPDVPIAEDVKELANDPDRNVPDCDILTAGYPCQPFSQAGKRRGTEDDRHIWPFIFTIIKGKRPSFCVFENVYGHVTLGLDQVLSDLESEAYATRPFVVPACATDAPHRRDRLWIICRNVADTDNPRQSSSQGNREDSRNEEGNNTRWSGANVADAISARGETWASDTVGDGDGSRSNKKQPKSSGSKADVADAASARLQRAEWSEHEGNRDRLTTSSKDVPNAYSKLGKTQHQRSVLGKQNTKGSARGHSNEGLQGNWQWKPEPPVGRVAHGIPRRVDRLRGLGNAIVPQIAMRIGQTIKATYDA